MRKADRTRQYIVEQTAPLFNKRGFHGTSLSDLTDATALTKGSLYGNFSDKKEIAQAAFQYACQRVSSEINRSLASHKTNAAKIEALLNFFSRYVFDPPVPGGCPLLNTAVEADDENILQKDVVAALHAMITFIVKLLQAGKHAGEFKQETNSKSLAYTMFCAIEGAIMFSRVTLSPEPMRIVIRHCKQLMKDIRA